MPLLVELIEALVDHEVVDLHAPPGDDRLAQSTAGGRTDDPIIVAFAVLHNAKIGAHDLEDRFLNDAPGKTRPMQDANIEDLVGKLRFLVAVG